ncbi:hypothetical protein CCACVL1_19537, partial [Corchorus capsularis]
AVSSSNHNSKASARRQAFIPNSG